MVTEWAPIETQRLKILIQETINGVCMWFRVAMSSWAVLGLFTVNEIERENRNAIDGFTVDGHSHTLSWEAKTRFKTLLQQ